MGFDGFFFGRLGYNDKLHRLNTKTMEQVWHTNQNLGSPADLFFGALYNGYGPPPGFCYDRGCNDPPIQVKEIEGWKGEEKEREREKDRRRERRERKTEEGREEKGKHKRTNKGKGMGEGEEKGSEFKEGKGGRGEG